MPRKTSTPKEALDTPANNVPQGRFWLPNDAPWGGFVNIQLTDEQKAEFHAWLAENKQHVAGYLDDHLGDGIKFGASYDRQNEACVVTYAGALMGKSNHRYCVTSRAGTLDQAIALAVWKHEVLAQGDYGNYKPRSGEFLKFG